MKISELEKDALKELEEEKVGEVKEVLKERLEEIGRTTHILEKLKKKYEELLTKEVEDVIDY